MSYDKSIGYTADHAPGDDLDYGFDWADVLVSNESITQSVWAGPSDIALSRQAVNGQITYTFAAGGEDGRYYQLVNEITTNQGRIYNRMITLACKKTIP